MPLEIFVLITPLGIALVVLIIRYSGLSKTARLNGSKNAIDIFHRDFAGENVSDFTTISSACFSRRHAVGNCLYQFLEIKR
jgi:hypothetical protein